MILVTNKKGENAMNRIQNPFSANLRSINTKTVSPIRQADVYRHLVSVTGETDIIKMGDVLKANMPGSATDYALYISL